MSQESNSRAPRGGEWNDVVEVLHWFTNILTALAHYPEGHPAIPRAIEVATDGFARLLAHIPELSIAITEGEYIVCGRPMPELLPRLPVLAQAMQRHEIECVVFQRGLQSAECAHLGRTLALPKDVPGRVRAMAQADLVHVLLRFAEIRTQDKAYTDGLQASAFQPAVQRLHDHVVAAFGAEQLVDLRGIRAVASDLVSACAGRSYLLQPRCYVPGASDQAAHATNVAMMTASLAIAGRVSDELVVEIVAAALVHDIGNLLSPVAFRGVPEPALDEQQRRVFRNHPVTGAWALLTSGCPALWVAVALEHHRGMDGGGYPTLETPHPPHELVRLVALASFFDRKRTLLDGRIDEPEDTIRQAAQLESSYFGPPLVARFLSTFGVYPPGTFVELSNRQAAQVTHASPHDPMRPQVRLITGPQADHHVDLKHRNVIEGRHELSIARAILPPLALRDPGVARAELPVPVRASSAPEPTPRAEPTPAALSSQIVPPQIVPPSASEETRIAGLGGLGAVPLIARNDLAGKMLVGKALDHRGGFLLGFLDGVSTVEDLLDVTGLPRNDVLEILEGMLQAGVIRMR